MPVKRAPAKKPRKQNQYELQLLTMLVSAGIPKGKIEPEYEFHPTRNYRADFAIPSVKLLIELHGGIWRGTKGAHTSGAGRRRDNHKCNAAQLLGWTLLACDTADQEMWNLATMAAQVYRERSKAE